MKKRVVLSERKEEDTTVRQRFDELTPSLDFARVVLAGTPKPLRGVRRIILLVTLGCVSLPLLGTSAFGMNVAAKLKERLNVPPQSGNDDTDAAPGPHYAADSNDEILLAAHTNVGHTNSARVNNPHTNTHTNNASRHVNVPSEVGHFNTTRPHMNSHFNNPHVNTPHTNTPHTNVNVPSKTGRESG